MTKVFVLSDTHGNLNAINSLKGLMQTCDYVVHLGDHYYDMDGYKELLGDKLITVKGNCDGGGEEIITYIDGVKTLIVHGDKYHVKLSKTRIFLRAKEINARLVLFGHTHKSEVLVEDGITFVNPGSMTRFGSKSYCYLTVNDGFVNADIVNV